MKKTQLLFLSISLMSALFTTYCTRTIVEATILNIEAQSGSLTGGESGEATFVVNTQNIDPASSGSVEWYADASATSPIAKPAWLSTSLSTGDNRRTLTVSTTSASQEGKYYFHITIHNTRSLQAGLLTIDQSTIVPPPPPPPPPTGNIGPRGSIYEDPANGYYVSPTGDDASGTGAIDKPFKTINKALEKAPAGSTVVLRGGSYKEGRDVRIRRSGITIKSAKGEWAVIDLTTYNSGHDEDSAVEFYAEDMDNGGIITSGKLQSLEIMGGFYAVNLETKWEWGQADRSGASNIIIEDCLLHDSKDDVVKVKPGCKNITIRYNEIYNSGREWLSHPDFQSGECNSEGIDIVNGTNVTVQNNYIHDICSNALYAKGGATDAIIENNRVERAFGAGIQLGFDTSPQYFDHTLNPNYYENIRGIVRNNLIIDVGWEGIGLYASKDVQVYNNTIVNAVTYGNGNYHSPIYFGIATQDWDNPTGCPPNVNPNIHHNIVSQPSTYNNRMIDIRYANDVYVTPVSVPLLGLEGKPTMNYNCYYVAGKSATFTDNRPGSILSNAGLAAWKTHIGGDTNSIEVNPSLDSDYLPTNAQCAGMGITGALK